MVNLAILKTDRVCGGLSFIFKAVFSSRVDSAATFYGGLLKNSEAKELFKLVSCYQLLTEAYALYI